jgi:CheY-like chemotaxis protein
MIPFRYRILVLDDDGGICTMANAILESQGYEVHCATGGFGVGASSIFSTYANSLLPRLHSACHVYWAANLRSLAS